MVVLWKVLRILGFLLAIAIRGVAAEPTIYADISPNSQLKAGKLEGILSVYHSPNQVLDTSQVLLDNQPLKVELVVDSNITADELLKNPQYSPQDVVTILRFELEGKPEGLYVLPVISIPVGGERIFTTPSTYDIQHEQALASLRLEPIMDPSGPFYPGQRAHFGYRIYFDQPTELSAEILPLLSPDGFEKIGQEDIQETPSSLYTVQEIIQEVRAQNPGSYALPVSEIQGRNFREDSSGQRLPFGPVLHAETSPLIIEIHPFPETGQPASFTGIVGPISLDVNLLSSNTVLVGDELRLSIRMTHDGDLEHLALPDLACQPGFSGFFRFNDFPPTEQTNGQSKEFIIILRPLSTLVTTIPAITSAYFDPQSGSYQTVRSEAIPITVTTAELPATPPRSTAKRYATLSPWKSPKREEFDVDTSASTPMIDQLNTTLDTRLIGALIAAGAVLVGIQWWLREKWKRLPKHKRSTSTDLMIEASKHPENLGMMADLLERALIKRLKEKQLCTPNVRSIAQLADSGPGARVKTFVSSLHHSLYGGGKVITGKETLEAAREIYQTLE